MKTDLGHLVLTLKMGKENGEAITLLAHNPDGDPVPVYIELADSIKGCRCGNAAKRARIRVVAPRSVSVTRIPHAEVPE
jgi:hypothetical protein